MRNKRLKIIIFTCIAVLLIPLIAMQFTNEVQWTFFDFVVAGILLFGTGFMCEVVMRMEKIKKMSFKVAICIGLLFVLLLIWVELAVGIF